jgi:hypothetical protein
MRTDTLALAGGMQPGVRALSAHVWTPTGEDTKSGVEAHGEVVLLCRNTTTETEFANIAQRVSAELSRAGVQTLGAASPYLTGGGLFGVTTDATTLKRSGVSTGIIADF